MQITIPHGTPKLSEFRDIPDLQPPLAHTFPTVHSLRWAIREHRDELVAAGAIIKVAGRVRGHPDLIEQAMLEIGRRAAGSGV